MVELLGGRDRLNTGFPVLTTLKLSQPNVGIELKIASEHFRGTVFDGAVERVEGVARLERGRAAKVDQTNPRNTKKSLDMIS